MACFPSQKPSSGLRAALVAYSSDSSANMYAVHVTPSTDDEGFNAARYQERWRFQVREPAQNDATNFPESWAADHGTPKLGLLHWLGAQPRRKTERFATKKKLQEHRAYRGSGRYLCSR